MVPPLVSKRKPPAQSFSSLREVGNVSSSVLQYPHKFGQSLDSDINQKNETNRSERKPTDNLELVQVASRSIYSTFHSLRLLIAH